LGYNRQVDQVCSFLACQDYLLSGEICQSVHCKNNSTTWGTDEYNIRHRSQVYFSFLGIIAEGFWDSVAFEYITPSQSDGQSERTIQTLEDILRACVLEEGGDWERYFPLVEFAYNNIFHSSIGMAPYEALYGRKFRSLVCWFETAEKLLLGPNLVQDTTDGIRRIKERLKKAQDRQKSYADQRIKPLEFEEGEHVFL
jgi:hypothetical protein